MPRWVRQNYPDVINSSCGFHVHVSLKRTVDYSLLMEQEFYSFFLARAKVFGEELYGQDRDLFLHRLSGHNTYCEARFQPDEQVWLSCKDSARYCHLNFCYALRGTLECRLFPMFQKHQTALEAARLLLWSIESYLHKNPQRRFALHEQAPLPELETQTGEHIEDVWTERSQPVEEQDEIPALALVGEHSV